MAANPVKLRTGKLIKVGCVRVHIAAQPAKLALGLAYASTQCR